MQIEDCRMQNRLSARFSRGMAIILQLLSLFHREAILHFAFPILHLKKSRTSLCGRISKTQPAWGSTRATCHFIVGAWQKSDAPALQAGSKRERYPPSSTILRLEPEQREGCKQISK